jgi:hypothetical protein
MNKTENARTVLLLASLSGNEPTVRSRCRLNHTNQLFIPYDAFIVNSILQNHESEHTSLFFDFVSLYFIRLLYFFFIHSAPPPPPTPQQWVSVDFTSDRAHLRPVLERQN